MPLAKPPNAVWQPGRAPAGVKCYLPFLGGASAPRDASGHQSHGTLVGSPAWSVGPLGRQMGGFTASDYVSLPGVATALSGTHFPIWMACCFVNTSTADGMLCGASLVGTKFMLLRVNRTVAGTIAYEIRDDAAATASLTLAGQSVTNSGGPCVLMGVSRTASRHELWLNGVLAATSASTVAGARTFATAQVGRAGTGAAFPGSVLAFAAGSGSTPDPAGLSNDWINGLFSAVRPPFFPFKAPFNPGAAGGGNRIIRTLA